MKKIEVFLGIIVAIILSTICIKMLNSTNTGVNSEYATEGKEIVNKIKDTIFVDLSSEIQPQIAEAKQLNATIDGEEVKNKYYYNQLDQYAKIIYTGLYRNKEQLKTGTYTIDFDTQFSQLLNQPTGQEILNTSFQSALDAFLYDNVDVYYLDASKLILQTESTTSANATVNKVTLGKGDNTNYYISTIGNADALNIATTRIDTIKKSILDQCTDKSVYEQLKIVHNWIIDNIRYDESTSRENTHNIYGALIETTCVCEGYAKAFKYIIDDLGINNILVSGSATNTEGTTELHAWNYICIDDNWYAIDVTWDDPIIEGNGKLTDNLRYKYFLQGKPVFDINHTTSGHLSQSGIEFKYPILYTESYVER